MPVACGVYYTLSKGNRRNPTLLLIHGAGSNRLCWPPSLRRYKDYQVLSLDLPGHGNSSEEIGYHTIKAYADRVAELQKTLGLYGAVLVGHSMGGAISLTIALEFPDLVSGLGLIASGAYFSMPSDLLDLIRNPLTRMEALALIRQRGFSPNTPQKIIDQTMDPLARVRHSVLLGDWNACDQFDVRDEVGKIQVPVWIAVGVDDGLTPPAHSRYIHSQIKHSSLQVIRNAGHMVILEQTEELTGGFQKFMIGMAPEAARGF